MILPGFGPEGQLRLGGAHVVVVGCGALGCATADLLARAGVGRLTLVDRDVVEWTNLQRQVLFDEADAASEPPVPKAEAARRRLARVNSSIRIEALVADFDHRNALDLLKEVGFVESGTPADNARPGSCVLADGTDNFETRYLLNDLSVRLGVSYAYAGVVGTTGMAALFRGSEQVRGSGDSGFPCLRCLFEHPPAPGTSPTCDVTGVLGPAVSVVAGIQAAEILRHIVGDTGSTGVDADAAGRSGEQLTTFDLATGRFRTVRLPGARRSDCVCCAQRRFEYLDGAHASGIVTLCGRQAVQISPKRGGGSIDLSALAERLGAHGQVRRNAFLLTALVPSSGNPFEVTVFRDGRAIVQGTESAEVARTIYARFIGS